MGLLLYGKNPNCLRELKWALNCQKCNNRTQLRQNGVKLLIYLCQDPNPKFTLSGIHNCKSSKSFINGLVFLSGLKMSLSWEPMKMYFCLIHCTANNRGSHKLHTHSLTHTNALTMFFVFEGDSCIFNPKKEVRKKHSRSNSISSSNFSRALVCSVCP